MRTIFTVSIQTIWQIAAKGVSSVSTLVIFGIVARSYGQAGVGDFSLSLVYLGLFYILVDFGFNAHILPELQSKGSLQVWRELLGSRLIWATGLMLVYATVLYLLPGKENSGFSSGFKLSAAILGLNLLIDAIISSAEVLFQSKMSYQLISIAQIFGSAATVAAVMITAKLQFPQHGVLLGYVFGLGIVCLVSIIFLKKLLVNIRPIFKINNLIKLLSGSWLIGLSLVLNVVYFRIDSFLLNYFHSNSEVGIYNLSYQVFQSVLVLPTFVMNSYYPIMLHNLNYNKQLFLYQIKKAALVLLIISILLTAIIFYLADPIISLVTSNGFVDSISSIKILSISYPAFFLSALGFWLFIGTKKYKTMLWIYAFGLAINLLANLIFIPRYSYIGAAYVTVFSEYLILILQAVNLIKILR